MKTINFWTLINSDYQTYNNSFISILFFYILIDLKNNFILHIKLNKD